MKTVLLVSALSFAGCAFAAVPTVSNVRIAQDARNNVIVTYDLADAAALVTVDFQTNGVSIGAENYLTTSGDVNCVVPAGTDRQLVWKARKDWPDREIRNELKAVVRAWAENAPPDIMVVDLVSGAIRYFASTNDVPGEGNVTGDVYKKDKMAFRRIPARGVRWQMGSLPGEIGRDAKTETNRWVTLSQDYYLAIYECTQAHFKHLLPATKCANFTVQGDMRPSDSVSYQTIRGSKDGVASWPNADPEEAHKVDGTSFLGKLRGLTGGTLLFDLPTEAEWEFACRGGCESALYTGNDATDDRVKEIARYGNNSDRYPTDITTAQSDPSQATALVGTYPPNAFGLYDMLGNVAERCIDRYAVLPGEETVDPVGATSGTTFVIKGGCWRDTAGFCRAAGRGEQNASESYQSRGFRVCLTLPR